MVEPVAKGPVSNLIVILEKEDKPARRNALGVGAARLAKIAGMLAAMSSTDRAKGARSGRAADELTPAERKVIGAVAQYPSSPNKIIADALHISGHTLRNHLASIYAKLGVRRRLDLVFYVRDHPLDRLSSA